MMIPTGDASPASIKSSSVAFTKMMMLPGKIKKMTVRVFINVLEGCLNGGSTRTNGERNGQVGRHRGACDGMGQGFHQWCIKYSKAILK